MKFIQKLANERFAKHAARIMEFACYFAILFCVLYLVLNIMGRQTFFLHTHTGTFEQAIYAEENHNPHSRIMIVHSDDDIHVRTNDNDKIDLTIQIGISLMYTICIVPVILAHWFLSRVFSNINKGQIFTEQNSSYLLYYGLLLFSAAAFSPFIKLLICRLVNLVSDSQMSIATGRSMFNTLIPGIGFIVAAYIIHYGVHLQDEADHTL